MRVVMVRVSSFCSTSTHFIYFTPPTNPYLSRWVKVNKADVCVWKRRSFRIVGNGIGMNTWCWNGKSLILHLLFLNSKCQSNQVRVRNLQCTLVVSFHSMASKPHLIDMHVVGNPHFIELHQSERVLIIRLGIFKELRTNWDTRYWYEQKSC